MARWARFLIAVGTAGFLALILLNTFLYVSNLNTKSVMHPSSYSNSNPYTDCYSNPYIYPNPYIVGNPCEDERTPNAFVLANLVLAIVVAVFVLGYFSRQLLQKRTRDSKNN